MHTVRLNPCSGIGNVDGVTDGCRIYPGRGMRDGVLNVRLCPRIDAAGIGCGVCVDADYWKRGLESSGTVLGDSSDTGSAVPLYLPLAIIAWAELPGRYYGTTPIPEVLFPLYLPPGQKAARRDSQPHLGSPFIWLSTTRPWSCLLNDGFEEEVVGEDHSWSIRGATCH